MSPVSRRDPNSPKPGKGDTPLQDHKTPLRIFRNTFKGNQTPMTVVMLIVLAGLVAYLAPSGRGTISADDVMARVYGRDVLRMDLEQALSDMARRLGNQTNLKEMMPFLQKQALRQTVDRKLYEELAERQGIVVTDREVRSALESWFRQFPESPFYQKGVLKPTSEINMILAGLTRPTTLKTLEIETRSDLTIRKLMEQVASRTPVDEAWVALEDRIQNEKVSFEFASLTPDSAAVADPGDGTLENYLKDSGARFQYGPRRVLQYVALDQAALGDAIKVDDAALKGAYDSRKSQFTELDASHILFRAKTEAEFADATKKAEELKAQLTKGGDFAKAAMDLSEDPTARSNKGRLGWFKVGAMVKPFEDGAMALKAGEISAPVRTTFGIHLIKLEGRKEKTFEEVKEELRAQMTQDRFNTVAKDRLEQLRKRVGDKGDLSAAAKTMNLKVETSLPLLDDPGTTLPGVPEPGLIVSRAFEMKVQEVSKVQQAGDRYVVFRVQEEKPIAVPPLAEIRGKVLAAWKLEEARKKAVEKAQAALQSQNLTALAPVIAKENVTIQSLGSLSEHPAIRKALLDTAVNAFTPVLWSPDGQVWLARIKARTPSEPLTFEKRMTIVQGIQISVSQELLEAQRKDLDAKGRQRAGFSSLWGRFGGIWMNPTVAAEGQDLPLDLQ